MFTKATIDDLGHTLTNGGAALRPQALTTAAASVNGPDIDQYSFNDRFRSAVVAVPYSAVVKKNSQATLTIKVQDGLTSTAYADALLGDGSTAFVVTIGASTAAATQSNLTGVALVPVNVHRLRRHYRFTFAASNPAGSTGTSGSITPGAALILGGANGPTVPAS